MLSNIKPRKHRAFRVITVLLWATTKSHKQDDSEHAERLEQRIALNVSSNYRLAVPEAPEIGFVASREIGTALRHLQAHLGTQGCSDRHPSS
jgi:hypothetical protein